MAESQRNTKRNKLIALIVAVVLLGLFVYSVQDWHQIWKIVSAPDNIPIVAMLFLVPFFTWLGIKQARANDRLIVDLEADPKLAKHITGKSNRGGRVGPRSCTFGRIWCA